MPPPAPATPEMPARPLRKKPLMIVAIALIAILIAAAIVTAVVFVPLYPVNFNQTNQDTHPNINTLNLNLEASAAQVDVLTQNITDKNILIITIASGSRSIFGSTNPVNVNFTNETVDDVLTVNAKVTEPNETFASNPHVTCTVYINPALNLNLNVTTQAGQITLSAEKPATFQSVYLKTNAGSIEATMQNATIAGNIALVTQAGSVYIGLSQASVQGNQTVNLHSNAGAVTMDITQTQTLQGNLKVDAVTDLGAVTVGLQIDRGVGAKIVSQTNLGSIHSNLHNFSGNQSPIQSDNYPAVSNIEINDRTNLGSININANYASSTGPNLSN